MADFSSWGPHQTLHSGVEPIGAVPTPTLVILRSLLPRSLVSSVNPVRTNWFEIDYFYLEPQSTRRYGPGTQSISCLWQLGHSLGVFASPKPNGLQPDTHLQSPLLSRGCSSTIV